MRNWWLDTISAISTQKLTMLKATTTALFFIS